MPRASHDDEPNVLFGRVVGGKIEIRELLGEGAMGFVFRGWHRTLAKPVAVKVLKATAGWDAYARARFEREARSAARFDHPNSVQIIDFGEDGDDRLAYIAMELIDGRTLASELAENGTMRGPRLARIMVQVLAALAAAHDRGVIHRDIKSANIMFTERYDDDGEIVEVVKVCDFGVAKMADRKGESLTQIGAALGTPAYMSPEQAAADPVDARSDVYSCGVVMYEMLSGRVPYLATSLMSLVAKHIREEPPHLVDLAPRTDPRLARVVHWAIEKRRELRCPSARELRRALKEYLALDRGSVIPSHGVPALTTQTDLAPPPFGRQVSSRVDTKVLTEPVVAADPNEVATIPPPAPRRPRR